MQWTTAVSRLGRNDCRLIGRDWFLLYLFAYILITAMMLRVLLPKLNAHFAANGTLPFALSDIYPLLISYWLVFLGAALVGMVFGFVLLEEKDDNTLTALLVTPLPLGHYLAYRVGVSAIVAFITVILAVVITNIAVPPLWQLALIAAGTSLTAPIVALYFAAFGENKVQGLALSKFVGMAGFFILLAWLTPEPLQLFFGLFPPYWISKSYWLALEGNPLWLGALALGILLQAPLILGLLRRFQKVVYRL